MLGLTSGELSLVVLLIFAVVSARFWPALGESIAVRLGPQPKPSPEVSALPKSERTNDTKST